MAAEGAAEVPEEERENSVEASAAAPPANGTSLRMLFTLLGFCGLVIIAGGSWWMSQVSAASASNTIKTATEQIVIQNHEKRIELLEIQSSQTLKTLNQIKDLMCGRPAYRDQRACGR